MNKITLTVATPSGEQTVTAFTAAPGLAVHKMLGDWPGWSITHVPTGRWLALADTRPAARRVALAISGLADWPSITVHTVPPGLMADVHRIAQSISPPKRRM